MRKRIKFRDNMEALAADENTLQGHIQDYSDELVGDFLQAAGSHGYSGFRVTRKTSTSVTVAPGRYYDTAARMHGLDGPSIVDLTPHLPAVTPKIVAIVVYGQTLDAESTVRDFIDPVTEEAVPRQVYLEVQRQAVLTVIAGTEAGTPIAPVIPAQFLGLALVRLTPAGILDQAAIDQLRENEISSLNDAFSRIESLEAWRRRTNAVIAALRSDLADLSRLLRGLANTDTIAALSKEVARLREEVGLPDVYTIAHSDNYLTPAESNTAHIEWSAKVDEGLRFADANADEQTLALLSPIDAAVVTTPGGMVLPRYRDVVGLSIGDRPSERDGEVPFAQFQTCTIGGLLLTLARLRLRYGEEYVVAKTSRYWRTGEYDPVSQIFRRGNDTWIVDPTDLDTRRHQWSRSERFFEDAWEDAYWPYGGTEEGFTGKVLAQTRLATANRWVTGYDLRFTRVAAAGNVTLFLAAASDDGRPDFSKIYSYVTLEPGQLKANDWTHFPLEPFLMARGSRYAIVVVTAGDHWLQVSNSNDFTQGTLFTVVDADFPVALVGKDICLQEHVAQFEATQTIVDLEPWNLDGGISGIDVLAPVWRSLLARLHIQVRINGAWHNVQNIKGPTPFIGLPPLVQVRMIMAGSHDIAPGVRLGASRVRLTRPRTTGRALSKPWLTPAPVASVSMTILLSAFDDAFHALAPKLRIGAGYATIVDPASVSVATRRDGATVMTATFSGLPNISSYVWQFDFTTTSALKPFVIEEVSDASL